MKTVIVTGASRGIGHQTVIRFVEEGWRVVSCSRDNIPEDRRVDNSPHRHFPADLADEKSIDSFVERANSFIGNGPVHALVNNAGVSPKTSFSERLGTLNGSLDHWREVFDLNFFAPLILARGFGAALHRGEGAIVNVTSIAGHRIHPFAEFEAPIHAPRQRSRLSPGKWLPIRPSRCSCERCLARRDRDRDAVSRVRRPRSTDTARADGESRRSGQHDLLSVFR